MKKRFNQWFWSESREYRDPAQRDEILAKTIGLIRGSKPYQKYQKWKLREVMLKRCDWLRRRRG